VEGEQPVFGSSNEIFFRRVEGTSAFLYSVREDGTGLRRVRESPVIDVFGVYPDRKWVLLGTPEGETVFPIGGGAELLTHIHIPDWLRWSGDGKYVFVCGMNIRARTYVLPLSPGQVLPATLATAKDFVSEGELAKTPGVRTIPAGDVVPGPTADIYAFTRETVQRNIYRIPVP